MPKVSNTPKNPGDDGTATPSAMMPWRNSAAVNGAPIPSALNPNQNDSALVSQNRMAQPRIATNRLGLRGTLSPDANASGAARPRASSRGATLRTSNSYARISHDGKNTIV